MTDTVVDEVGVDSTRLMDMMDMINLTVTEDMESMLPVGALAKQNTTDTVFQDPFSEEVWRGTYKDHKDNTIDDTFRRVARNIASAETTEEKRVEWEEKFYDMLTNFKAVAGGRITANAGTEWGGTTFANCFIGSLPEQDMDSINGIYKVLVDQANTLKSEGGWGMNFSFIRPRGAFIKGVGVESPGAIRFMELFDKSSEIVTAGSGRVSLNKKAKGKIRKGAMMSVLDCTHPDIVEFVTAKQTPGRLTKFNMSVNCTDEFMQKVVHLRGLYKELDRLKSINASVETLGMIQTIIDEEERWDLIFPDMTYERFTKEWDGHVSDWIDKGYPVNVYDTVKVSWLWNLITESTYNRNEPGILFLDRAQKLAPLSYFDKVWSVNPCGEQVLAPGGVCCLGTLNLTRFVNGDQSGFDLRKLEKYVSYLVRFLDNVNSISNAPLPEYVDSMRNKRRIGCGVMGWGSSLFMMRVKFGSKRARELQEQLMQTYSRAAYMASIDLAEEKGKFAYCDPEQHAQGYFVNHIGLPQAYLEKLARVGIRNSSVLSQQPNGNGSIFANIVSGGIEPVFMPEYIRTVIQQTVPDEIKDQTPNFAVGDMHETEFFKWAKEGDENILRGVTADGTVYKIDSNRGLTKEVLCEDYGVRFLKSKGLWDPNADWAVTTTDISAKEHVEDLRGFAEYTDSSCSKTANLPFNYPFEDFKNLYLDAYNTGTIKGFTTYRAGTMTSVLSAAKETIDVEEEIIQSEIKLPDSLPATLKTIRAEGRKWYLTVILNENQTKPVALFAHTNNHEKTTVTTDAIEQLLNLAITKGIPLKYIEDVTTKATGDANTTKICRMISLCLRHGVLIRNVVGALEKVDCIAGTFVFHIRKYLATFIKDGERVHDEKCLECGSDQVVYQEGCKVCMSCGSSKCG